ncbi:tetratricopeptide repeat protein [uncultured Paludibaculum sp.]|uniref:tetratricopeptide repeat protein n=1 Tax=uncultured Paludibaculum sp. TaxID=1765020 RepID=UPI002AAC3191|nr:tetratricopeptide repeat protein [uncultured Paludibaculum sp.]
MRFLLPIIFALSAGAQTDPLLSGLEAYRKGDLPAAERNLRIAAKSPDPRASAFLALTLAATGRCDEAVPALKQAYKGTNAEIARLAGLAFVQCRLTSGPVEEAAAVINELKAKHPADADVLYQSARLYMRAWNDTIYLLYQKAPSSFRVNQLSGEVLETQGQFTEAAAEYRKAIAKNPRALNLHFRLGRALLMSAHSPDVLDAAMREFQAELALNPSDSVVLYQIAQILQNQQKPQEAAAKLQQALALNPEFPEALIALGKVRVDEKKNDEAITLLQRAVKLSPGSESAHYSLMMAYRNAGRMAEARREKAELDRIQKAPEGEFTDFLKKLGEKPPGQ